MEVSYNLRYQKSTFSNRVLIDKEGEVIIYTKGFRLKGKGAADKGELLNFSEIKEFYYKNEAIFFVTFSKEKYILSDSGTQFDELLRDIYKSRNEFLMDALFMKAGKLKAEFDGHFERVSKFARPINKGSGLIRLYENSMVIVPKLQDAFSLRYSFVNFSEFDDMEYRLKVVMDDGMNVFFSHLGNDFMLFEEKWNELLGGMYESIINGTLREAFGQFNAATLLKMAYKIKGGKTINLKELEEIDTELAEDVDNFMFEDEKLKEKMDFLRKGLDGYEFHYGVAKDETVPNGYVKWFMVSMVEKNLVAFTILPRWEVGNEDSEKKSGKTETYFYKVIMEKGNPADKVQDKIHEIEQALVTLKFVKDPCYKDKRDLKHSPYQYAIRKMPFLRILRKSFIGKAVAESAEEWIGQVEKIYGMAKLG